MSLLPHDFTVFERGWLSSNNVLLDAQGEHCLIDSGYHSHSEQTLALITAKLGSKSLTRLVNTHLHSDHCGGNAILQSHFPDLETLIPPGQAPAVAHWDPVALSYSPTGQFCPPFHFDAILSPGKIMTVGDYEWQIHSAPGHDPHSLILFEADAGILISADALWQNGFGVVFPEIEGLHAFSEVSATLDLIESLKPKVVIPGHGPVFTDVGNALKAARRRLEYFVAEPKRHALHAAKVLIKFKLLEVQQFSFEALAQWVAQTSYFSVLHQTHFADLTPNQWLESVVQDLIRAGAAEKRAALLLNL